MEMRPCYRCGEVHPLDYYPKGPTVKGILYRNYICKICNTKKIKEYRQKNPAYVKRLQDQMRVRVYRMSADEFNARSAAQDGRCEICGERPVIALCVDHDHTTGKVRGLVCNDCNLVIGRSRESIERLAACIKYLEKHKP